MSGAPNRGRGKTDQINQIRRRFMLNAAMTLAAAELGTFSSVVARPSKKKNDKIPAIPGTNLPQVFPAVVVLTGIKFKSSRGLLTLIRPRAPK